MLSVGVPVLDRVDGEQPHSIVVDVDVQGGPVVEPQVVVATAHASKDVFGEGDVTEQLAWDDTLVALQQGHGIGLNLSEQFFSREVLSVALKHSGIAKDGEDVVSHDCLMASVMDS